MPATASLIRLRSAVKGIDRVPRPSPTRATRSALRQTVEEAVDCLFDHTSAAEPDVRLVDGQDDQPSVACLLVRAVSLGCERIRTRRALHERCPVGGHHAARDAVDEHLEIRRQEIGNGTALVVHDGDVDRDDVDTGPEPRWLLRRRRLAGGRPWSQRDAAEEHRQSCREVAFHRSDAAGIRYAVRARTPECPSTSTLMRRSAPSRFVFVGV